MKMKLITVILLVALGITQVACTASQFEQYMSSIGPAVAIVLQIVAVATGTPYKAGFVAKVDSDVAAVDKIYKDFEAARPDDKTSIRGELDAGFQTLSSDITQAFSVAQVSDKATQDKVTILVNLTWQGFKLAEGVFGQKMTAARAGSVGVAPLKAKELRDSFNKVLHAKTGNVALDKATSKMNLPGPSHVKSVRVPVLVMP
jgi:hypothetical protein